MFIYAFKSGRVFYICYLLFKNKYNISRITSDTVNCSRGISILKIYLKEDSLFIESPELMVGVQLVDLLLKYTNPVHLIIKEGGKV